MKHNNNSPLVQLIKYGIVGMANTMLTLGVIFVCKSLIGVNPYVSNALGYFAGIINSFFWNRKWVFKASGRLSTQAIRFIGGFVVCYMLQFILVWALNQSAFGSLTWKIQGFTLSGYGIATLLGNIVYTLSNFIYNRTITFGAKHS